MANYLEHPLIQSMADTVKQVEEHQHPRPGQGPDLYCLNLTSWMGERMPAVLRVLADAQAKIDTLERAA